MDVAKPIDLDSLLTAAPERRLAGLTQVGRQLATGTNGIAAEERHQLVDALATLVESGVGTAGARVELGEVLGLLGDPRVRMPTDTDYWIRVAIPHEGYAVFIGRFPVTNAEFQHFVDAGGYDDEALWSAEGRAWLASCADPWPARAAESSSSPFVVPNQPVVGVTWFEAEAYASAQGARLPRFDERLWITRGEERRPYPWGSPFGGGNANTQEEVVGRPCAVGLFVNDRTPEGVRDLAGNVAEWNLDGVGDQRWIHPGAWDQPSMAAWAKARFLEGATSRWAGLGFRIARDAE